MKRIRWTQPALEDLKAISAYVEAQRNLTFANRVCRIIYNSIQIFRRFPETGKPGMESDTREMVVPSLPIYIGSIDCCLPETLKFCATGMEPNSADPWHAPPFLTIGHSKLRLLGSLEPGTTLQTARSGHRISRGAIYLSFVSYDSPRGVFTII